MAVRIEPLAAVNDDWLRMRRALWPEGRAEDHVDEMNAFLADPARFAQFIAYDDDSAAGFVEAAVRHDYVNGAETSPVVFLEGIYVVPASRRRGIGRLLVSRVAKWARAHGIREFASDAPLDNDVSHALHKALGFEETERVVFYRMMLDNPAP